MLANGESVPEACLARRLAYRLLAPIRKRSGSMAVGGKAVATGNFALLDGLRGLGAILVLVGHTMMFWAPVFPLSGAVIVDCFFVLSGFVIAFSYEAKFDAGMGAVDFMTHRIVR